MNRVLHRATSAAAAREPLRVDQRRGRRSVLPTDWATPPGLTTGRLDRRMDSSVWGRRSGGPVFSCVGGAKSEAFQESDRFRVEGSGRTSHPPSFRSLQVVAQACSTLADSHADSHSPQSPPALCTNSKAPVRSPWEKIAPYRPDLSAD